MDLDTKEKRHAETMLTNFGMSVTDDSLNNKKDTLR